MSGGETLQAKTILTPVLSACGFLMLAGAEVLWWVGFACAAAGLFLSSRAMKRDTRRERLIGIIGVSTALAAAILYILSAYNKQ